MSHLCRAAALLAALPWVAEAQTTPVTFFACYGSLTGVVYRIKEEGLPANCLHRSHVQFSWTSGGTGAGVSDHGALAGLGDDDHPQYLLGNGSRALTGSLNAGGNKLTNVAAGEAAGEAVPYEQAVKSGDAAGGDLSGSTYPDPVVSGLQGTAVSSTPPSNAQVLAFNAGAGEWTPTSTVEGTRFFTQRETVRILVPGGFADPIAVCPGTPVTGGGYAILNPETGAPVLAPGVSIVTSMPLSTQSWQVFARNTGEQTVRVMAVAVCGGN
jgi:hypothetical protein